MKVELGHRKILAPGKLLWLRAVVWAVAMFVIVGLAASLFTGVVLWIGSVVTHTTVRTAPGPIELLAMIVAAATAVSMYVGLVHLAERRTPLELAPGPAPLELAIGLLVGAAMMAVAVLIMRTAGWAVLSGRPVASAWSASAASIESGFVEEVLLRLIVLRLLWRAFGIWPALALSALLFGALHLHNPNSTPFAALCIAVEAGIMLAAFYILTGRLWVSIGVHAGWNFTQGWIFGAAVSGTSEFGGGPMSLTPAPGVPEVLSGGGFGPEASLAGLIVGTAVGVYVLYRAAAAGQLVAVEEARGTDLPAMEPPAD